jgi:hypothetical protein
MLAGVPDRQATQLHGAGISCAIGERACTEGLIEGHIATDIIITISGWADPSF